MTSFDIGRQNQARLLVFVDYSLSTKVLEGQTFTKLETPNESFAVRHPLPVSTSRKDNRECDGAARLKSQLVRKKFSICLPEQRFLFLYIKTTTSRNDRELRNVRSQIDNALHLR